jgi:uncharacterized caspase-like protein
MREMTKAIMSLTVVLLLAIPSTWAASKQDDVRVAVIMGNGAYTHTAPLPNPPNDARAIALALQELDFQVHLLVDASKMDMQQLEANAERWFAGADVGLFFYAGHGLQINGENFIVPVDATFADLDDISGELTSLTATLKWMEEHTATNIIFLDACRNNPLADVIKSQVSAGRSMSLGSEEKVQYVGQGLAEMEASVGTLIAYATQPGNVAEDGQGSNSPFTTGLLRHILEPGAEIREILTSVRVSVLDETNQRQIPWDHSSLTEEFYFIAPVKPRDVPMPPP